MFSRLLTQYIFGLVFIATSSFAFSNTEFTYNVIDGGIEVTGCVDECPNDLVIPEEIDGYSVTNIGPYAFSYGNLTNVLMPNGLKVIGLAAFRDNHLSNIVIPDTVSDIDRFAFMFNELTSVMISSNLSVIKASTFYSNQLTTVAIPDGISSIGKNAFSSNQINDITLPEGLLNIEPDAFWGNLLTSLVFPSSVTEIESYAFYNNPLTSILFKGHRPNIGHNTFSGDFHLIEESPLEIFYCTNTLFWPGDAIEGITPQLDETCEAQTNLSEPIQYAVFDIDQNGSFDALTDGLILLRYAFGLRGDSLTNGVIASDASRTSASEIEAHIQSHLP